MVPNLGIYYLPSLVPGAGELLSQENQPFNIIGSGSLSLGSFLVGLSRFAELHWLLRRTACGEAKEGCKHR